MYGYWHRFGAQAASSPATFAPPLPPCNCDVGASETNIVISFHASNMHKLSKYLGHSLGLTLVHFSALFEPCLPHKNTLHTLHTPQHPLNTGYTTPTRTPYPIKNAQVELRNERV